MIQDIPSHEVIGGAAQGVRKGRNGRPACAVLQRILISWPPLLCQHLAPCQQVLPYSNHKCQVLMHILETILYSKQMVCSLTQSKRTDCEGHVALSKTLCLQHLLASLTVMLHWPTNMRHTCCLWKKSGAWRWDVRERGEGEREREAS